MSDTGDSPARRNGWLRWLGLGLGVALAVAVVVWAVTTFRPASESAAPATSTPSGANAEVVTPTPQPTEFETPEPGATETVDKPEEAVEVSLDEPATAADDIVVEVTSVEAVTAGRDVPGEQSGPAIAVSVRITNDGEQPVDTSGSNVNLEYGGDARIPAVALTGGDGTVWPASIAPGDSATAVFLFSKPAVPSGDIRVIVDLLATEPVVVFVGSEP
jgi:cytoskeletal protein RodZ